MLFIVFTERFAYPIFLDSVILAELHCDVSPKSHLSGIYIYYNMINARVPIQDQLSFTS